MGQVILFLIITSFNIIHSSGVYSFYAFLVFLRKIGKNCVLCNSRSIYIK